MDQYTLAERLHAARVKLALMEKAARAKGYVKKEKSLFDKIPVIGARLAKARKRHEAQERLLQKDSLDLEGRRRGIDFDALPKG